MTYTVTLSGAVDFAPDSEVAEILQNVRTILNTRIGTVPLARDFGVSLEHLDKPYPVARAMMTSAVIDAIEAYEPRARIESVEFDEGTDDIAYGIMRPRVIVSIGEEEEGNV